MRIHNKVVTALLFSVFVTTAAPWELSAQDTKSGVVNSRDQILNPTTNEEQVTQQKANPEPPECDRTKAKCPESPSKPGDVPKGKGK